MSAISPGSDLASDQGLADRTGGGMSLRLAHLCVLVATSAALSVSWRASPPRGCVLAATTTTTTTRHPACVRCSAVDEDLGYEIEMHPSMLTAPPGQLGLPWWREALLGRIT